MRAESRKSIADASRVGAFVCFDFCAFVAIFFGVLFVLVGTASISRQALGAYATIGAITLPLPMATCAVIGVIVSLVLRRPRGLLLLAGLTVLEPAFLRLNERLPGDNWGGEIGVGFSLLLYGVIVLWVSGRWFYHLSAAAGGNRTPETASS